MGLEKTHAQTHALHKSTRKNIVSQTKKKYCVQALSFKIWWRVMNNFKKKVSCKLRTNIFDLTFYLFFFFANRKVDHHQVEK